MIESKPKPISIRALAGGDDRLIAAHDRAVERALAWIEQNMQLHTHTARGTEVVYHTQDDKG